jgi:hypothetical protein
MHLPRLLSLRVAGALACLLGTLSPLAAQTTASTAPRGIIAASFPVGNNALALPLIAADRFIGTVSASTATTATFAAGNAAAALTAGKKYYAEVETGPFEGERFDLDTAASLGAGGATIVLDLAATSASTSNTLGAGALAGARLVIRAHNTLGTLTTLFTPALTGNNSAALADSVQLYEGGALRIYYLRSDGVTWRESGKAVDETGRVIPPDTSLLLVLRSGARTWDHAGLVRRNVFRVKLAAGTRALATGFPLDLSPLQIGGFIDSGLPANRRWVGSDSAALADTLQVFDPATGMFILYYLRANGTAWRRAGQAPEVQNNALLAATGMAVLTRANPDADYLILRPFSL